MPELPEVESYRRLAEAGALGRRIRSVEAPDAWFLKRGLDGRQAAAVLAGSSFTAARRRGKLMLLDVGAGDHVLGVRFGMTGSLTVDRRATVERLLYSPAATDARYERFGITFEDGGRMTVSDSRRLGGVEVDPDEGRLGPDALTIRPLELRRALEGSRVPLKARLLDQSRIAGVGNLIADEVLWRAGLDPARASDSLDRQELDRLSRHLRRGLALLIERGGSHTGDLQPHRRPGGRCPRDQAELRRLTVGGRTTWWCPAHQL